MLRQLSFAFRALRRHKMFSVISIGGLLVSMTAFLLMALYIENERSFDRFNVKADRIYRVTDDKTTNALQQHSAASPAPLSPALLKDFPVIEAAARIIRTGGLVAYGEKSAQERSLYFADPGIFNIFSIEMIRGNAGTALSLPSSVVLTRTLAEKYFAKSEALGKIIQLDNKPMKVTGVVNDVPATSHWQYDMLISMSTGETAGSGYDWLFSNWYSNEFYTYILLRGKSDPAFLTAGLDKFSERSKANTATVKHHFSLEKLTDIYLHSDRDNQVGKKGSLSAIYIFSAVAFFILLLATINFVNLSTARASERAKEVAIKKVNGVEQGQLLAQFFLESFLLTAIALAGAACLTSMLLPAFNEYTGKNLSAGLFLPGHIASMILLLTTVGLLSGIYPALVLSRFDPITSLKGRIRSTVGEVLLRKSLVVFQFSISIVLVVCSIVVYSQLHFMQQHDLGFDQTKTLVINFEGDEMVQKQSERIRNQLLGIKGVTAVSASSNVPGDYADDGGWSMDFVKKTGDTIHAELPIYLTDLHFLQQYRIPMTAGRELSPHFSADTSESMIINETALRKLGFRKPEDAIGVKVGMYPNDGRVIGVFRDFHFESLQKAVAPLAIRIIPDKFRLFSVQVSSGNLQQTIADIERLWKSTVPQRPLEYSFLDESFNRQYDAQLKFGQLFSVFTALAILIACFGLFGLVVYSVRQRTREIGIRRVIGASVPQIVYLLSADFTPLIGISVLIATPVGFIFMKEWIDSFAYRIHLSIWIFIAAALMALIIALLTISFQAIRAAVANPVNSLRSE